MAGQRGKRNWGPQVSPVCAGSGSGVVSWPGGWKSGLRAGRVAGGPQGPQTATSSPCAYGSFVHVWRDCMLALLLLFLERLLFRAVLGSWQIRVEGAGIAHVLLPPPPPRSLPGCPHPPPEWDFHHLGRTWLTCHHHCVGVTLGGGHSMGLHKTSAERVTGATQSDLAALHALRALPAHSSLPTSLCLSL